MGLLLILEVRSVKTSVCELILGVLALSGMTNTQSLMVLMLPDAPRGQNTVIQVPGYARLKLTHTTSLFAQLPAGASERRCIPGAGPAPPVLPGPCPCARAGGGSAREEGHPQGAAEGTVPASAPARPPSASGS